MANKTLTICNIPIDRFAAQPTAPEMAAIIANMDAETQATFFGSFYAHLLTACFDDEFRRQVQISMIAKQMMKPGHGCAVDFFDEIASFRETEHASV